MRILPETPADIDAIFALTQAAFADHPHSEQTEGYINDALRRAGALTLSLVAHEDGRQVGHAAFSPVTIGDGSADWYGLGPVAVLPGMQGRGVGAALIREGLARLRALGAAGCVVMGIRRTTAASASRRDRTCATRACRPSTSWPWLHAAGQRRRGLSRGLRGARAATGRRGEGRRPGRLGPPRTPVAPASADRGLQHGVARMPLARQLDQPRDQFG